MANENMREDRELDWNSSISYEGPTFMTLPAGDYEFTITDLQKGRYEGNKNKTGGLPPCPMATITMTFRGPDGQSTVQERLFLHTRCEGILCSFFTCIGQRKHGDKVEMDWSKVVGSSGKAALKVEKWTGNDGVTREQNRVNKWLPPEEKKTVEWKGGF